MAPLAFTEALPAPSDLESAQKLPPAPADFFSTPQGELSFFRSIVYHRLVGPEKHFNVLGVVRDIETHSGKHVEVEEVWKKYGQVYNQEVLETTWADQVCAPSLNSFDVSQADSSKLVVCCRS